MKKLILTCFATASIFSLSSCDTIDDHDHDRDHHFGDRDHHHGSSTTTTTTEESRVIHPGASTVETQTIRSNY